MSLAIIVGIITIGGAALSFRTPTEDELKASFAEAQRFYAEGAYDQAVQTYRSVSEIESRVLNASAIQVIVGEEFFPVQEAALYQLGNAFNKRYADFRLFAENDPERRADYLRLADSSYAESVRSFEHIIDSASSEVLRGMAHGRLIEMHFDAGIYQEVVRTSKRLISEKSSDQYALSGYYNLGWAYFEMGDYELSISAFIDLIRKFPNGYRTDRSLFQIGEAYLALGDYRLAIDYYQRLVKRQQIEDLTEEQLVEIQREKIAGLVDETALELAAKAEIRTGTCFGKIGEYEAGAASFRKVIERFSSERILVEEAYLRLADMREDMGDIDGAILTYREAIDASADRSLRARIQYALAERLFSLSHYDKALSEFRIYLQGYDDIASNTGFSADRVHYRMGNSFQQLGQLKIEKDMLDAAKPLLTEAVAHYDIILLKNTSSFEWDARFNRAYALQSMADPVSLRQSEEGYNYIVSKADHSYVERALMQLAELSYTQGNYEQSDSLTKAVINSYPEGSSLDDAHMRRALALQKLNRDNEAIEEFLLVDIESSYYGRSRMAAGHSLIQQRIFDRAVEILHDGLPSSEMDQRAGFFYLIGQAYVGMSDFDAGIRSFNSVLENDPESDLLEAARLTRGNAALSANLLSVAETDFNWIISNVSDQGKTRFAREALILLYLRQNRGEDALSLLDGITNQATPEEKAELLSRILDLYYGDDDIHNTRQVARRLLALDFSDSVNSQRPFLIKEKALYLLGELNMRLDDEESGREILNQYLVDYADGYFVISVKLNLATDAFSRGDLDEARSWFQDLLRERLSEDQRFLSQYYLANVLYSLRDFSEARSLFSLILTNFPEKNESLDGIYFGFGESNYQLGNFSEAIQSYRFLLENYPESDNADDAKYNLAWCLIELQRREEAMQEFAELLTQYPDSEFAPSVQFTFGDYAYNAGEYGRALEAYNIVEEKYAESEIAKQIPKLRIELNEAIAYKSYEKGLALMDSAEVDERKDFYRNAISVFSEIIEQHPGTESALGALSNTGVCLEGLGEWIEAVKVYDKVISLYEKEEATRDAYRFALSHRDWILASRL